MRRPAVTFLVNGAPESAMGERARAFVQALSARFACAVEYRGPRRLAALGHFLAALHARPPDVTYVLDAGWSGVGAASLHAAAGGAPWVLDTGDAIAALARALGTRGRVGEWATHALEQYALHTARAVVVRGTGHARLLAAAGLEATVVQDGVDTQAFAPTPAAADAGRALRRELGLEGALVVGFLGSTVWNPRRGDCAGLELVELLARVQSPRLAGVLVGDGDGLPHLQARARALGVEGRLRLLGRQPHARLPALLALMDVALSTQTDDAVGQVRTTGKLPLYLAAGRYVLASDVGEAREVLPAAMRVPYRGSLDPAYPTRLAERVQALLAAPAGQVAAEGLALVDVARRHFDYTRVLAPRVEAVLGRVLGAAPP